jgi:hypothetical protein
MISIGANGQKIAYGIKHYNLDTESELSKIQVSNEVMGCTCFIIESSKYYMLNGDRKWIEISPFGAATGSGGGGGGDNPEDDGIFDGGTI